MAAWGKVVLCLVGPRKIIPVGVTVETKLSNTWSQLLNEELELKVSADRRGLFVCTSGYNPSNPEGSRGWRAELDDKIGDFVKKYERKRKPYRVHLCRSRDEGNDNPSRNPDPVAPPRRLQRAPTPGPSRNQRQTRQNSRDALAPSRKRRAPTPVPRVTQKRTKTSTRITPSASLRCGRRPFRPRSLANLSISPPAASPSNLEEEVGTSTGFPSVPGPHVFFKKQEAQVRRIDNAATVKVEDPSELVTAQFGKEDDVNVIDIAGDEDGGGEQGIVEDGGGEQQIVEVDGGEQQIVEVDGGEQRIVEDDGGEQAIVEVVNGGIPEDEDLQLLGRHWGEDEARVEFGGMSDEEEDGIGGNAEDGEGGEGINEGESKEVVAELRQLGIRYEDIKSIAGRRFSGFSNAYMLRIRSEIRKMMRDKEWMDVFQRAPLAFYFIQQLLKD